MSPSIKPILLTADSQLLFWKPERRYFLDQVVENLEVTNPLAVYLGASNSNQPEFYEIFEVAMNNIGIRRCQMLMDDGKAFDVLSQASLVLLAGGNVNLGWKHFHKTGIVDCLKTRYTEGAQFIGISAGAVQMGQGYYDSEKNNWQDMLSIVPYCIGAHQETNHWQQLSETAKNKPGCLCIGIPSGGGLMYHPDGTIQPIRHALAERVFNGGKLIKNTIEVVNNHYLSL